MAENLSPGDLVTFTWFPDRKCTVRYNGNFSFEVIESENAKIQAGDRFSCISFTKGRPLYIDRLQHCGDIIESYAMGTQNGISHIETKCCAR